MGTNQNINLDHLRCPRQCFPQSLFRTYFINTLQEYQLCHSEIMWEYMFNDSKHRRLIWKRKITKAEIFLRNLFVFTPQTPKFWLHLSKVYRTISTRSLDLTKVIFIQKLGVSFRTTSVIQGNAPQSHLIGLTSSIIFQNVNCVNL